MRKTDVTYSEASIRETAGRLDQLARRLPWQRGILGFFAGGITAHLPVFNASAIGGPLQTWTGTLIVVGILAGISSGQLRACQLRLEAETALRAIDSK